MPRVSGARPMRVAVLAVVLWIGAVLTVLGGVAASMFSNCCGSPDPADPKPAFYGLVLAVFYAASGTFLWQGQPSRRFVAALAAVPPVAAALATTTSSDAAGVFLMLVLVWLVLAAVLRSAAGREWFQSGGRGIRTHDDASAP